MDFDHEDTRRTLIAKRNHDGANTPVGRTYSNIIEILDTWLEYAQRAEEENGLALDADEYRSRPRQTMRAMQVQGR